MSIIIDNRASKRQRGLSAKYKNLKKLQKQEYSSERQEKMIKLAKKMRGFK